MMRKFGEKTPFYGSALLLVVIIGLLCFFWIPLIQAGQVDDDEQIGFIWEPPANAEATVQYYHVYLSVNADSFHRVAATNESYYVVQGDSGHCYRLRVAGVNARGEEGTLSPQSDEVLCLPQEGTPVVFDFAAAQSWPASGQLKLVWETTGYLLPSTFQIRRRSLSSSEEQLLELEVREDLTSESALYRYWCIDRDVQVGERYRYTILAMDPSGYGVLAISFCAEAQGPREYHLFQNYPNPFNAETALSYQIPEANQVVLTIFNAQGQKVCTLLDAHEAPGLHVTYWDGTDQTGLPVASGIYFCQIWCGDFMDVKKMAVLR